MAFRTYQTKPMFVKAIQYNGKNLGDVAKLIGEELLFQDELDGEICNFVIHEFGDFPLMVGDFVTFDVYGEVDVYTEDAFRESFDLVEEK